MCARRDKLAHDIEAKGAPAGRTEAEKKRGPTGRAFAIATAQLEQQRRAAK